MKEHTAEPVRLASDQGCKRGQCEPLQRGVSLIEVLVAIVVLTIGLLGLAGLQASGMRVGQSSIFRGQAAQLAYDIVERIRANASNAAGYNLALTAAAPGGASVAERDLQDWRARLQALPRGVGSVAVNGSTVTVVVQWDDTRGASVLRGTTADDAARLALATSQFSITTALSN